jgi:hypothetical protein
MLKNLNSDPPLGWGDVVKYSIQNLRKKGLLASLCKLCLGDTSICCGCREMLLGMKIL